MEVLRGTGRGLSGQGGAVRRGGAAGAWRRAGEDFPPGKGQVTGYVPCLRKLLGGGRHYIL